MEFISFLGAGGEKTKALYSEIIEKEWRLSDRRAWDPGIKDADDMLNVTRRILESATQSIITRAYNIPYGLTKESIIFRPRGIRAKIALAVAKALLGHDLLDKDIVFESVAAHTNLVKTILEFTLDFKYRETPDAQIPFYRELMKTAGRHDLPENISGDTPDNNSRDEKSKNNFEAIYQMTYNEIEVSYTHNLDARTSRFLGEMVDAGTPNGRLLLGTDKLSAIIESLCLDFHGFSPQISRYSKSASELNREQMDICGPFWQHWFKASELWTVDYLISRRFDLLDDTGFLTGVLVMATLIVNQEWYDWRIKSYS